MPRWAEFVRAYGPYGLALWWMAWAWPHTIDDAYISFQYADRLVQGHGLVFNPGERVEGFTNPTWTLTAALFGALGLPYALTAKLVGALVLLWALREAQTFARIHGHSQIFVWLAAAAFPLSAHAVMGLETSAYAALLFVACLRTLQLETAHEPGYESRVHQKSAILWAICMWSRPETPLFFACVILALFLRMREGLLCQPVLFVCAALVASGLALVATRWVYYGELLPNTYFAKTGGDMLGVPGTGKVYVEAFIAAWWPWLALSTFGFVCGLATSSFRSYALTFASICLCWLAYAQHVGGDWMLQWRFMVPWFLPAAWLVGHALWCLWQSHRVLKVLALGLGVALGAHALLEAKQGRRDVQRQISEWDELVDPPVAWLSDQGPGSVAVGDIGWIAFESGRDIVDVIGLIDKDIARSSGGYGNKDKAVIASRVFGQQAQFLIVMAPVDCTQAGYPALRALAMSPGDELWYDYALAQVFSLGKDGLNCVFERLNALGPPRWLTRFELHEPMQWRLSGSFRLAKSEGLGLEAARYDAEASAMGDAVLSSWHTDAVGASQSGERGDGQGEALSPVFEPDARYLRFELAGGGGPGLRAELIDATDGEVLRRVTGRGDRRLRPVYWDLSPLAGRKLQLRIRDEGGGEFGMLFVDNVALIDPLAEPAR